MANNGHDAAVLRLATKQYGAFSIDQTKALGVPRWVRRNRLKQQAWLVAEGEVLVLAGSLDTWRRRLTVATLAAGGDAAVTARAALAFWGVKGFDERWVEVVSLRHRTDHRLAVGLCHETRYLPESHIRVKDGIRVVCVERAICDAAALVPKERLPRMVDDAILQRLTTPKRLLSMCDELSAGHRRGLKHLRRIAQARANGQVPTDSDLEDEFLELVRDAGLPEPDRQVSLGGRSTPAGRVDFLFRPRLVAEVDGSQHELSELQRAEDRRRDEELEAAGYLVERFSKQQIRRDREAVIRRLWEALARAA